MEPLPQCRILEIRYASDLPAMLHGMEFNQPQAGSTFAAPVFPLAGWALGRDTPVRSIEVFHEQSLFVSIPVILQSGKIARRFPDVVGAKQCGFQHELNTLGLPPEFQIDIEATFRNSVRRKIATISGRHQPLEVSCRRRFRPLILTSLARTGTTCFMNLIRNHPAVALTPVYPFEARPACYWMHFVKVLGRSGHRPNTFQADMSVLPPCPANSPPYTGQREIWDWFNRDYLVNLARFAIKMIDEYYDRLRTQGDPANAVEYFAEKCLPSHLQWLFYEFYPEFREIVLLRDYRDMICSMLAFNRKRGFATFGREHCESDEEFIRAKANDVRLLLNALRARQESSLCIQYERLVREPEATLEKVLQYLDLPYGRAEVQQLLNANEHEKLEFHRTSSSDDQSIGRWKRDLPVKTQVLCRELFGDLLIESGYEV